jgi:membrane fusion protein, heavy metal efflux system
VLSINGFAPIRVPQRICTVFLLLSFVLLLLKNVTDAHANQIQVLHLNTAQQARMGLQTVSPKQSTNTGQRTLILQGKISIPAQHILAVTAPAAGVIEHVMVQTADKVNAKQALLRIASPSILEWQRDLRQAEAAAHLAQTSLERDRALYADGVIAQSRLQNTEAQYIQSHAYFKERRELLKLAGVESNKGLSAGLTLTAPFTSTVLEMAVFPGQRVEAGALLARLGRAGERILELQVPIQHANALRPGQTVRVAGCDQAGKIIAVHPSVSENSAQTVLARASLPTSSDCVRLGQHVEAHITLNAMSSETKEIAYTQVPSAAVVSGGGQTPHLYLVLGENIQKLEVKIIGQMPDGWLSIANTLPAQSRIVVAGTAALKAAFITASEGTK